MLHILEITFNRKNISKEGITVKELIKFTDLLPVEMDCENGKISWKFQLIDPFWLYSQNWKVKPGWIHFWPAHPFLFFIFYFFKLNINIKIIKKIKFFILLFYK